MADEMNSTCTDKAQDQTEQAVPDADTARMADTMAEDATAEGATEADTACNAQAGAADDRCFLHVVPSFQKAPCQTDRGHGARL